MATAVASQPAAALATGSSAHARTTVATSLATGLFAYWDDGFQSKLRSWGSVAGDNPVELVAPTIPDGQLSRPS
ncbi:MAG: hypothetical protein ACYDAN_07640 [Candidatus Limnocylindrales bacterium]